MLLEHPQYLKTDVLVIGGGGAGLRAAIEARKFGREVLLVSKSRAGYGNNTAIAMAMFAASGGDKEPRDNPLEHSKDTVVAGCYLNNQELVQVMTEGAWQQVKDLEEMGANYKRNGDRLWIMHVPGHTYSRHVSANRTIGVEFSGPMRQYASKIGVRFLDGLEVTDFLVSGGEVFGAVCLDGMGGLLVIWAAATVLATGGAGEVFLRTNNAGGSTGDGFALCYENGLPLVDMEMVQFYPTTVGKFGGRLWAYEVVLGRGATLRNRLGEDVLEKHNLKNFVTMTRDKLARVIMLEILEGNGIDGRLQADLSTVPPDKIEKVRQVIEAQRYAEKALVAPAAHYFMGGVMIDRKCETGLRRLFVAGEVCGGIHGANRLAGNAITDILVFGTIAGKQAASVDTGENREVPAAAKEAVDKLNAMASSHGGEDLETARFDLRQAMWEKAGIVRSEQTLQEALEAVKVGRDRLKGIKVESPQDLIGLVKLGAMLTVSEMVCRSAILRRESRGSHYRTDFPQQNNRDWLKNIVITKMGEKMELTTSPVAFPTVAPPPE